MARGIFCAASASSSSSWCHAGRGSLWNCRGPTLHQLPQSSHHRSLILDSPEVVLRYSCGGLPVEAHTLHTGSPIGHAAVDARIAVLVDHPLSRAELMLY